MFEFIKALRPYFFSVREIDNNVSLDIKLPLTWSYDTILAPYKSIKHKIQDKNDKYTLISLVTVGTKEGYDVLFSCANEIIKINKEEEEKRRLFEEKVQELKKLFASESLDKLKELNFINNIEDDEQEEDIGYTTGDDEIGEGHFEEQGGIGK